MKASFAKINLLSATFLLVFSASALALPTVGQTVKLYDGPGTTGGGEFGIDILATVSGIDYKSFCLEFTEYIILSNNNNSTIYTVGSVEEYANRGGGSIKKGAIKENGEWRDYLDPKTKWVYWNYIQKTLPTTYNNTTDAANDVQNIIWMLEGEKTGYTSDLYNFVISLTQTSINGNVKVLNLLDSQGNVAQSQIIGEPVPEPATMLLFGTGVAGLAGIVRRRRVDN